MRHRRSTTLLVTTGALAGTLLAGCTRADTRSTVAPPYTGASTTAQANAAVTTAAPGSTWIEDGQTVETIDLQPPQTSPLALDRQLWAVSGGMRWRGDVGHLEFDGAGNAAGELRLCPPTDGGPQLGFTSSCAPTVVSGVHGSSDFRLTIAPDGGTPLVLAVYLDAAERFHVARGKAAAVRIDEQNRRRALIPRGDDEPPVVVVDNTCTVPAAATTATTPAPNTPVVTTTVPCEWRQVDGLLTLTVGDELFVYDRDANVVATPAVYFSALERQR